MRLLWSMFLVNLSLVLFTIYDDVDSYPNTACVLTLDMDYGYNSWFQPDKFHTEHIYGTCSTSNLML